MAVTESARPTPIPWLAGETAALRRRLACAPCLRPTHPMIEPLSLTATQYYEPSNVFVILERSEISPRANTRSPIDSKPSAFALRTENITVRVYDWITLVVSRSSSLVLYTFQMESGQRTCLQRANRPRSKPHCGHGNLCWGTPTRRQLRIALV